MGRAIACAEGTCRIGVRTRALERDLECDHGAPVVELMDEDEVVEIALALWVAQPLEAPLSILDRCNDKAYACRTA